MSFALANIPPTVALGAGVICLIMPRLTGHLVALALILFGIGALIS